MFFTSDLRTEFKGGVRGEGEGDAGGGNVALSTVDEFVIFSLMSYFLYGEVVVRFNPAPGLHSGVIPLYRHAWA